LGTSVGRPSLIGGLRARASSWPPLRMNHRLYQQQPLPAAPSLAETITELAPDLLAVQEVGDPAALRDLANNLAGYAHLATADPDGRGIRVGFLSEVELHDTHPNTRPLLHLSIRDDGIGGADPAGGSGLIGPRYRVQALGGSIEVNSPRGRKGRPSSSNFRCSPPDRRRAPYIPSPRGCSRASHIPAGRMT
jgi:hypothetical protein